MRKIAILSISVILCTVLGCGSGLVRHNANPEGGDIITAGQVIDAYRLKEGGRLLIIPFTAGVGVPADDTIDSVSLMIVKGLIETIKNSSTPFDILSSQKTDEANLIIRGHIVQFAQPHGIKKWIGRKYTTLEVDGQLIDPQTGNIVLYFSDQKMFKKSERDFSQVAYDIGQGIGRFILQAVSEGDT